MTKNMRDQIIHTTCELLESQGYAATGLNQIVKEAAAPKGSLYYYFPEGKEALAAEAVQHVTAIIASRIRTNLEQIDDPVESLRHFIYQIAEQIEVSAYQSGGPLMTIALETATTNERLNRVCQEAYESLRLVFEEKLLISGYAPDKAAQLSTAILAAVEGGILLSRTYHSGDPLRRVGDLLALSLAKD